MRLNSVISCDLTGSNIESDLEAMVCIVRPGKDPGRIGVYSRNSWRSVAGRADYAATLAQFSKDVKSKGVLADAVARGNITKTQAYEFLSKLYRDPDPAYLELPSPAAASALVTAPEADEHWVLDADD